MVTNSVRMAGTYLKKGATSSFYGGSESISSYSFEVDREVV